MRLGNIERMKAASTVLRVLSFGGGVQSSALLLMALEGELPRPDAAVFSDPGWESRATYEWIDQIESLCLKKDLPFHRVSAGNIREATLRSVSHDPALKKKGSRLASLPFHVRNQDGDHAMLRRQCTQEFKIAPLVQKQRELLGVFKGQRVPKEKHCEVWIGISLDEIQRVSEPRDLGWATNYFPLIERRMTRQDCLNWLRLRGYPQPPKSACLGCPFQDNTRWREMRDNRPDEWADAVEFDEQICYGMRGVDCPAFLHRSMVPLSEVDLSTAEDMGQLRFDGLINECEGMCGL